MRGQRLAMGISVAGTQTKSYRHVLCIYFYCVATDGPICARGSERHA